ncbi:lipopolysaccharide transport periplasmic protein LptA [Hydrogenophaga sp. 2FB]|uniref:lipopolysaccharide transport periplasmic protein LptA n=1 Tax=Hydrogenophaga sp. 2FB TaxID=2502187 RepID=UPI00207BB7A6|nr:lipopolysaccharide transport periplasmic protein LptA [Hydrogenophaga sp. 2FB]
MPATTTFLRTAAWVAVLNAAVWSAAPALAEKADRNLPLNAEADALRYDDARQTSVFTGNVVITKGTIIIRGNQVEVRQDPQGNQFGVVHGTPGFFRQKRDGVDEFIEGTGQRIDYDSKADTVKFTGNAVLKRFKGTQLNDETSGNVIVYNNTTDVFTVDGGVANRTAFNPTGRVRAMLTPVPKEGAPAPSPAPVPAPPATLKPTPQIEEGRQ